MPAAPAAASERPQPKITPTDTTVISLVQADMKTAGLQLGAVSILPMTLHRNADEFSGLDIPTWVNSGTEIYFNVQIFLDYVEIFKKKILPRVMQGGSIPSSISPQLAMDSARATAVILLHHGLQLAQQFGVAGRHPKTFAEMAQWSEDSYSQDEIWVSQQSTRGFLLDGIGLPDWYVDGDTQQNGFINFFKGHASSLKDVFDEIKDLAPDSKIRNEMINHVSPNGDPAPYLPESIQGNPNYLIGDLFRDK